MATDEGEYEYDDAPQEKVFVSPTDKMSMKPAKKRNFHDERLDYINEEYPDRGTQSYFYVEEREKSFANEGNKQGDDGEMKVLEMLRKLKEEPMVVVRSQRYMEETYGEIDFLIMHRTRGVIILEVKSGKFTAKKFAKAKKQLDKAVKVINTQLKRLKLFKNTAGYTPRYAPVFPDGVLDRSHCEERGCFIDNLETAESFKDWFYETFPQLEFASTDKLDKLYDNSLAVLVSIAAEYLYSINDSYEKLIRLTKDQAKLVEGCAKEQYICGPAGSGKTEVLIQKVRSSKLKGQRILVLCFNKGLADYLDNRLLDVEGVSVKTFSKLYYGIIFTAYGEFDGNKYKPSDLVSKATKIVSQENYTDKYDSIFIDEAQDLEGDWEALISALHVKGPNHHLWVFFDQNQRINFQGSIDVQNKNVYRLKYVIRNTVEIFDLSKEYFEPIEDCLIDHKVACGNIQWQHFPPNEMSNFSIAVVQFIYKQVSAMWKDLETARPGDISILVKNKQAAQNLRQQLTSLVPAIGAFNVEEMVEHLGAGVWPLGGNRCGITVDSISRFKGLESKAVMLFIDSRSQQYMEYMYTGITRCCCKLVIICPKHDRANLDLTLADKDNSMEWEDEEEEE